MLTTAPPGSPGRTRDTIFGITVVEHKEGLPKVDKEFYLGQREWYGVITLQFIP